MRVALHALLLTLIILTLNLNLNTMITQDEDMWGRTLEMHVQEAPFSLRPLTTMTSQFLAASLGLPGWRAFALGQYILVFILLLSFAFLLRTLGIGPRNCIYGMWMLAFSYPLVCVHFIPNFTWDDLWAYIGLVWMTVFLVKERIWLASACLSFAALSRENVLIAVPLMYLFRQPASSWRNWLLAAFVPLGLYAAYRFVLFPEVLSGRFSLLAANFGDFGETRQTLHSLFVSFGWLWALAGVGVWKTLKNRCQQKQSLARRLALGTLAVGGLCVVLTLCAALARETRLFFTPFVVLIPLAVMEIGSLQSAWIELKSRYSLALLALVAGGLVASCITFSILAFPSYPYLPMKDFHRVLFGLHLATSAAVLLLHGFAPAGRRASVKG